MLQDHVSKSIARKDTYSGNQLILLELIKAKISAASVFAPIYVIPGKIRVKFRQKNKNKMISFTSCTVCDQTQLLLYSWT